MTIQKTQAALAIENSVDEPSSHKLISLLMAGMLERVFQAKSCIEQGNANDKKVLLDKIVAIINGLRSSLNFEGGQDIAVNLDILYTYMIEQIIEADTEEKQLFALGEAARLVEEVKVGWDQIEPIAEAV